MISGLNDYNFADSVSISKTQNRAKAFEFWKSQCFEASQTTVGETEKKDLKHQITRLNLEHDRMKDSIVVLKTRRGDMERDLFDFKQKRMDMEDNSNGPKTMFIDPLSYEMVNIPDSIRTTIIDAALGRGVTAIETYLEENGVDEEVRARIGESDSTSIGILPFSF